MDVAVILLVVLVVGLLAGGGGFVVGRAGGGARSASLRIERDLLASRVADLERTAGQDTELALALAPLTSSLARVEHQVGALERDRMTQFGRLDQQLAAVQRTEEDLRAQTAALAGALRSPNVRGAWGEVQLKRVVEHAGMLDRVDFTLQLAGSTPDGDQVRPDAVVHLPGGKHVVVDAKAPLAAYLEGVQGARSGERGDETADRQRAALHEHGKALRRHVDALAGKQYWTAFSPAPELVVCFVPGESFLAAACEADPSLLEYAMARRVALATPTTLLAMLRTVALTWQQDALTGSARELFDVGRELYGRLAGLGTHLDRLGRSLQRSVEDYNGLVGTVERRVLVSARRMQDLGVADGKLVEQEPLTSSVRPLSAPELLDERDAS
ncbi:MAG: DNA recombination protein RmuC [Actinomycetes bacterium]